jgi:hypothetical protein
MNNKCVVYIGNGFDVACGFRTKYSQFIESDIFRSLSKESKLAQWIAEKHEEDKDKWSDLEELLYLYSIHLCETTIDNSSFQEETAEFKNDHRSLTLALQDYVVGQYASSGNGFIPMLIKTWQACFEIEAVCCFNYTPNVVLQKLLFDYVKLSRVHGELRPQILEDDVKIKLGIDRCMKVCKEHEFLYKDTMGSYGFGLWKQPDKRFIAAAKMVDAQCRPFFFSSDYIIIYGCSLGRSDTAYFKYLFENIDNRLVVLYHFGDKEKVAMMKRIKELAPNLNIDKEVLFIDNSVKNGYLEDFQKRIETHLAIYSMT